jgi:ribonucleoside-diphosphate reductase alpha chain
MPADAGDPPTATAVAASPVEAAAPAPTELAVIATNGHTNGHGANGNGNGAKASAAGATPGVITLNLGPTKVSFQTQADAPSCADCGSIMVRNGSCYKCLNCGSTSGCS